MTITTKPQPRITYYDKDMRVMPDLTACEAMYHAADMACDKCGNPAAMIGTGHRDTRCPPMEAKDPPPWFLCNSCYRTWLNWVLAAVAGGGLLQCNDCNAIFRTIDEFSVWRTV